MPIRGINIAEKGAAVDVIVSPSSVTSLDVILKTNYAVPAWTVVSFSSASPVYAKSPPLLELSPVVLR